jgi:hypothetical protein
MQTLPFTVDSALLRELGERLVGRAHIALAELIKNAYDADATSVTVRFGDNRIEVIDNGHGMTFDEFRDFWMRIGSPHKQKQNVSRELKRPLTGSKGVGRLAVQFLARNLELHTVAKGPERTELRARVDWDEAVNTGTLTEARARWEEKPRDTEYAAASRHGTAIILTNLNQIWDIESVSKLAQEVWMLQPPFGGRPATRGAPGRREAFEVTVESERPEEAEQGNPGTPYSFQGIRDGNPGTGIQESGNPGTPYSFGIRGHHIRNPTAIRQQSGAIWGHL